MKLRLLSKCMLLILIPVIIALGAISSLNFMAAKSALLAQINSDMELILSQQKEDYAIFYKNLMALGGTFSRDNDVEMLFMDGNDAGVARSAAELMRGYSYIRFLSVLKSDGTSLFSQGDSSGFSDAPQKDFFARVRDGKPTFQIFQKEKSQELTACAGFPVLQGQSVIGFVVIGIPMETIGGMYSDRIRIGKSGKCFVLNEKGVVLLDPTDKASIGMDISDIDWIRTLLGGSSGVVRYAWNGVAKTCYYEKVADLNWVVALGFADDDLMGAVYEMRNRAAMMSCVALLVLAGAVFWIVRTITTPLRSSVALLDEVGKGNMHISPEMEREQTRYCARMDEIGALARGIGDMHKHLAEMLSNSEASSRSANEAAERARAATQQVQEALQKAENARREGVLAVTSQLEGIADTLSSSATDLSARIEQSGRGSVEQSSRVTETVTAMDEMNSIVHEVAKNAGMASDVSAETRRRAEEGAAVVQKAVDSILSVQKRSLELKDNMASLGEYARSISQVMSVISDIADQTNLLALNAAIEAARAGDA